MSAEPAIPARTSTFSILDFARGIDVGAPRVRQSVAFVAAGGAPLGIDVYQPATRGRYPILVQIYGGAWQGGERGDNANFATLMASHGWVVFAIEYRHAPAVRWPALIDDVDSSLVWIRDHAAEYDGDTARIVLMGRSAGAHLAKLAAYRRPVLAVRGVVSYYGPADLVDAYEYPPHPDPLRIRSVDESRIGGTLSEKPAAYADASPITYAASLVPERWRLLYGLNPMTTVIDGFRWALLGVAWSPGGSALVSFAVVALLFASGLVYFRRMEATFADLV